MRRRIVAALLPAAALALLGGGGPAPPLGAAELHHAAVVIDTADGNVRKFCLAFPEESITGAEALRRIESDAVFASYGTKGQAVCSLCGVGCPAGDCFCDRSKYWAYHRAGPGGAPYAMSRAGVSATTVRDGDVEGWRWGTGDAPPAATVGEVCDVPEPPARTAGGSTSTTTTTSTAAPTTEPPAPASEAATPPPVPGPAPTATTPARPRPAAVPGAPPVGGEGTTTTTAATVDAAPTDDTAEPGAADGGGAPGDDGSLAAAARTSNTRDAGAGDGGGGLLDILSGAAFVGILGGVLAWRARIRRANVRKVTPVR